MAKTIKVLEFGEPLLRQKAKQVKVDQVKTTEFQKLIKDMQEFLTAKRLGVGLAAPQVGKDLSLAIVLIQPTKHRPNVKEFKLTIVNPEIEKTYGYRQQMWEGCISGGPAKSSLFARVPRYKKVELKYVDEQGVEQQKIFEGLPAQVIQHEVDHLNGVLFVDRVKNTKTFTTYKQYLKIIKTKRTKNAKK